MFHEGAVPVHLPPRESDSFVLDGGKADCTEQVQIRLGSGKLHKSYPVLGEF